MDQAARITNQQPHSVHPLHQHFLGALDYCQRQLIVSKIQVCIRVIVDSIYLSYVIYAKFISPYLSHWAMIFSDLGYQRLDLVPDHNNPLPVKGQIVISLLSRDGHGTGNS